MAEPLSIEAFPLFKGCTRPPILFGVPMVPLLSMAIAFLLAGLWFWMPIALCIVPMYFVMKVISKADEFRFRQWALALQLLVPITLAGQRRFSLLGRTALRLLPRRRFLGDPPPSRTFFACRHRFSLFRYVERAHL